LFTSGGLGLVILVLVLRIWFSLHHWIIQPDIGQKLGTFHTRHPRSNSSDNFGVKRCLQPQTTCTCVEEVS